MNSSSAGARTAGPSGKPDAECENSSQSRKSLFLPLHFLVSTLPRSPSLSFATVISFGVMSAPTQRAEMNTLCLSQQPSIPYPSRPNLLTSCRPALLKLSSCVQLIQNQGRHHSRSRFQSHANSNPASIML